MNNDDLKERFEDLIRRIQEVSDRVRAGQPIAFGNLEKEVAQLCKDVTGQGADIAPIFKTLIAETITRLDELAQDLTALETSAQKQKAK